MLFRFNPSHQIRIIVDFWKFGFNPEASSKHVRRLANASMSFRVGFTKIVVSSAYIDTVSCVVLP
jgi:hypothetical protein